MEMTITYFAHQCMHIYLQVRSNFRTAITVPERAWTRLRDIIGEYLDKVEDEGPAESGDAPPQTTEEIQPEE